MNCDFDDYRCEIETKMNDSIENTMQQKFSQYDKVYKMFK